MTGSPTPCTIGRGSLCSTMRRARLSTPPCAAVVIAMAVPCDRLPIASSTWPAPCSRPAPCSIPHYDADVSSIPPIIPYGGFSPVRLEGWLIRRDLPSTSFSLSLLPACADLRLVCLHPSCTS